MNLLFLGDSLIEYFDWEERFPDHKVTNFGVAGESVEGLLSRVVTIKEAVPDADIIFIMSGTNNVAMEDLEFPEFYNIILEKLSSFYPDAKIFVHSLLPSTVDFIPDESILQVNISIKALAKNDRIQYLDIYSRFVDTKGSAIKEYLLDDGIHVSTHGYTVWANAIEEIIDAAKKTLHGK
jgi:lysophospholipase L1-like esterase